MTAYTSFTKDTFEAFRENNRAGPIHMLNLVRLKDRADYPDGREASGAEAYVAYSRNSAPVFARLGGKIAWRGDFELMVVGSESERWDICFVAEYPSVEAFVEILRDPEYRDAMAHRQAGVADSRLVRLKPLEPGSAFGNGLAG